MSNILLVHQSKVIRATLDRHLNEKFTMLEAQDGESAWQLLVLNHEVAAVIAGPDIPHLHGLHLLERLRRNRLQRLRHIPFFFVGSETRINEIREEALQLGATDFIINGMNKWDILPLLLGHLAQQQEKTAAPSPAAAPARTKNVVHFRGSGLLSARLFEEGVRRMFAHPGEKGAVLALGMNDFPRLVQQLGSSTAQRLAEKLAHLVRAKIGSSDFMGEHGPGTYVIATRASQLAQCEAFAQRISRSLSQAQIAVRGVPVQLHVSAGAASRPEDGRLSGEAVLALALRRMEEAMQQGSGTVVICGAKQAEFHAPQHSQQVWA